MGEEKERICSKVIGGIGPPGLLIVSALTTSWHFWPTIS
jgi:hypothetical protein